MRARLQIGRAGLTLALSLAGALAAPSQKPAEAAFPPVLRVCAEPNNLPFSNRGGEGFENRLAELLAADGGARLAYTWRPQRRGFVRETLDARLCDVIMGVPSHLQRVLATRPYYRSTYVFVSRRDQRLRVRSFDDPALRSLRVGVHLVGDDYANTPPVHALARRGIVPNVRGYTVYGDYARPDPPADLIRAVARGEVDVAVAWGPLAGFFARRERVPLRLVPVVPPADLPFLPFSYDISMGVRREDDALRRALDGFIERRRAQIDRLLEEYGLPRTDLAQRGAS